MSKPLPMIRMNTLERMRTLFHQQETDWIAMDLSDWSNRSLQAL